jgi:hypothetical protein
MARVQYQRVTKRLDPEDVDRATWLCRSPSGKARIIEWADTECIGLVLRITKRDANWLIRRRDCTIRIGSCNEIGLRLARDVAQKTREAAKRGRNLKTFVERLVAYSTTPQGGYYDSWKDKNDLEYADTIADEKSDSGRRWLKGEHKLTWTWKNLTDQFLAAKLKTLKTGYRLEYEHYLLSLSETKSGHIGDATRLGLARQEYGRRSGSRAILAHPYSVTGACELDYSSLRKIEADAENAARQIQRYGQGIPVGSSRSAFHNNHSAMAIAARLADHECPSPEDA